MKKIGLIGWRGMVGSVLITQMKKENNFKNFHTTFFSTSQKGKKTPEIGTQKNHSIQDAWNIRLLCSLDIIITCQGSAYTSIVYPKLKKNGWTGYWIDSASYLRMNKNAIIILDPINQSIIEKGINEGIKTFVGGNCTVSLMLMSLGGLFHQNLIEWISIATYQAASGQGAQAIHELLTQMGKVYYSISDLLKSENNIKKIDEKITKINKSNLLPTNCFKIPLINNVIPWIGKITNNGQTQEEWKGQFETHKILYHNQNHPIIPIDSLCVRVNSLRCHSQAFTIKLKKDISLKEISEIIQSHNMWVKVIPNDYDQSLKKLNPIAVSGLLDIPIGRLRKMNIGRKYISAFSVGDQLLWGAAEPLRRMLLLLNKI